MQTSNCPNKNLLSVNMVEYQAFTSKFSKDTPREIPTKNFGNAK